MKRTLRIILGLSISIISPFLSAHPHAFISMHTQLLTQDQQLTGFRLEWKLDEISSAEILYDLKRSQHDKKAQQTLADEIMQNVASEHYFSFLYNQNDEPIKYKAKPLNYGLKAEGNQILYYFDVMLSKPQPLVKTHFSLLIYDPTYYVSMYYPIDSKASVIDSSSLPENCRTSLIEPQVDKKIQQYASSLDRMQRNEDNSLGAIFAQKVQIKCQ